MRDDVPVRLRIYDFERRGFESERDYPDVNMTLMTHIEIALRDGRSMQIEGLPAPSKQPAKPARAAKVETPS